MGIIPQQIDKPLEGRLIYSVFEIDARVMIYNGRQPHPGQPVGVFQKTVWLSGWSATKSRTRPAIVSIDPGSVAAASAIMLKRTPRMPPACRVSRSRSLNVSSTLETPIRRPFDRAIASRVTELSWPWAIGWITTPREIPRCSISW